LPCLLKIGGREADSARDPPGCGKTEKREERMPTERKRKKFDEGAAGEGKGGKSPTSKKERKLEHKVAVPPARE